MTTRDETPVMFEQRCNQGHFHIYVVPCYVANYLSGRYPNCCISQIDKDLMNEARIAVEMGEDR